jgi:hypothetical protein
LTAARFDNRDTRDRVTSLEVQLQGQNEKLDVVMDKVDGLDERLSALILELARKRSDPPPPAPPPEGIFLPKWLLIAALPVLGGCGAGILELAKFFAGILTHVSP